MLSRRTLLSLLPGALIAAPVLAKEHVPIYASWPPHQGTYVDPATEETEHVYSEGIVGEITELVHGLEMSGRNPNDYILIVNTANREELLGDNEELTYGLRLREFWFHDFVADLMLVPYANAAQIIEGLNAIAFSLNSSGASGQVSARVYR